MQVPSEYNYGSRTDLDEEFLIPASWYISYTNYLKGNPSPGKIFFSELLNDGKTLYPDLYENIDYIKIPGSKWAHYLENFGSNGEIYYNSQGWVYRKLKPLISEECTERMDTDKIALPPSAKLQKLIKKTIPKGKSFKIVLPFIKPKIVLGSFKGSDGFNAVFQLLLCIPQLTEFSLSNEMENFKSNDFVLNFCIVFLTAFHLHAGIIQSQFIHNNLKVTEKDPVFILQFLLNKIEIETLKFRSPLSACQGILLQECDCLHCGLHQEFLTKFTYLNMFCKTTLNKAYEEFICKKVEKWFCPGCQEERDMDVQKSFKTFPEYLIVCLFYSKCKDRHDDSRVRGTWNFLKTFKLVAAVCKETQGFFCFARRAKHWFRYQDERCIKMLKSPKGPMSAHVLLFKKSL